MNPVCHIKRRTRVSLGEPMLSASRMGTGVVQHGDTHHGQPGTLSLDGDAKVLEVPTITPCVDGDVNIPEHRRKFSSI
jgi:hypothetical protein